MKKILYSVLTLILGLVLSSSGCTHDTIDPALFDEGVEINGVVWATRNVGEFGKFAAAPESSGMFYQWNRAKAWSATEATVSGWDATAPSGTTWEATKDPCPAGWQVPTQAQFNALIAFDLGWDATKKGRKFGSGANIIFLYAAGYRSAFDGALFDTNLEGSYWTNEEAGATNAYCRCFTSSSNTSYNSSKAFGYSIRCVKK